MLSIGDKSYVKGKSVYLTDRDLIEVKPNTTSNSEHGQIYRFVFRAFQNKEGVFEDNECEPVRYTICWNEQPIGRGEISDVWPTTDSKGNSFATKVISLPKYAHYIQSHIEEHTDSTLQAKAGSRLQKRAESTMTANNSTSEENVTRRANDYPHYLNESETLRKLNGCQTIPRFITDFHPEAEASYYIVMEKVPGKQLECLVVNEKVAFTETQMGRILWDVLEALTCLEHHGLCHRNVHPSNVIVDCLPDCPKAHLVGFGHAIQFSKVHKAVPCGTKGFMAPEFRPELDISYSEPSENRVNCDVWGVGALLFFMITGSPPRYASPILEGLSVSRECKLLLAETLVLDPNARISVSMARNSLWFEKLFRQNTDTSGGDRQSSPRKRGPSSEVHPLRKPCTKTPRTNTNKVTTPTPVFPLCVTEETNPQETTIHTAPIHND
ncbi:Protein kinase domain [Pelomyxa schiedti]|nr:Protein kinase domain [Pelomyxa schiedti]